MQPSGLELLMLLDEARPRVALGSPLVAGFTSNSTGTASGISLSLPADANVGDILLASVAIRMLSSESISITAPSGWTSGPNNSSDVNVRGAVYWRVVQPGDTGPWTWTFSQDTKGVGIVVLIRNGDTADPVPVYNDNVNGTTGTNITAGSMTVPRDNSLAVHCAFMDGTRTITEPNGYIMIEQENSNDGSTVAMSYEVVGVGNTGQKTATADASNDWVGIHVCVQSRSETG